jgi:hypothetical protein
MKNVFILIFCFLSVTLFAQKDNAIVKGKVMDEFNNPLELVSVSVKGFPNGTKTNAAGAFSISVPVDKNLALVFTAIGYSTKVVYKRLEKGETINLSISLTPNIKKIKDITIKSDKRRNEAGSVRIDPKLYELQPTPIEGIESMLKIFLNGNNNEMTSQYNVRGGNFDENLVYINDFEVYRPFLVKSGQQEGLSIINPDLVGGVNFSTGGFQAKYGDKMSSVLDITYKRPKQFGGSVRLRVLGHI